MALPAVFSPLVDMVGWKRGDYFRMAVAVSGTEPDTIRQAPWGLVLLPNLGFVGALWQFRPTQYGNQSSQQLAGTGLGKWGGHCFSHWL